eukprot:7049931-Pyramimonas_sp.AAC.1
MAHRAVPFDSGGWGLRARTVLDPGPASKLCAQGRATLGLRLKGLSAVCARAQASPDSPSYLSGVVSRQPFISIPAPRLDGEWFRGAGRG